MTRTHRSFATKSGFCHLYPDRIELEQSGLMGKIYRFLMARGIKRMAFLYLALSLVLFLSAILSVLITNYFLALFFLGAALASFWVSIQRRNHSFLLNIPKSDIDQVIYEPAVKGVSRASFLVHFHSGKQKLIRIISLPSLLQNGAEIAQSAFWMMREEGLLKE